MIEYKVGDKVYVRRGVETGVPESMIDFSKPYTIIQKSGVSGRICTLDGNLSRFGFHEDWLVKAEEFPVPAEEPTFKIKVSDGRIKKVIFNAPATIVFWADGTKTVVKCGKGDKWDPEKGLAMACAKKLLGNEEGYHMEIAKYTETAEKEYKSPDEMRIELQRYCHGKWCGSDCVISQHRNDTRCVCGMGYGFTTDKNSNTYIKDKDIRVFYNWLKEGLKNG